MTFEQFLADVHTDLYPQILDDDLPDTFDTWLAELDSEEYLKWGEIYGQLQFKDGQIEELKKQLAKIKT